MKIHVLVKTKARTPSVEKIDETTFKVSVIASPIDGKANKEIRSLLSDYFGVPKTGVLLIRGETSVHKYFLIS